MLDRPFLRPVALRVVAAVAAVHSVQAASVYILTELMLPPGAISVTPSAISNAGQVVGTVELASAAGAFSYRGGTTTVLIAPADHTVWGATAVNDAGNIVGGTTSSQGIPKSAFWLSETDSAPEVLESGGGPDANVYTTGINNGGVVCGYYTGSGSGNATSWRAVKWERDNNNRLRQRVVTTGVTPLPPGVFHAAYGINNFNELAGTGAWIDPNLSTSQAGIKWSAAEQASELAVIPAFDAARYQSQAINDAGVCVGKLDTWFGEAHAMRWAADGSVLELGVLSGFTASDAIDINSNGQIVGNHTTGSSSVGGLYENGVWVDLNTLLIAAPGWQLQSVAGINNAGWITGKGMRNGAPAGFLIKPSVVADLDHDADVDQADVNLFKACASRAAVPPQAECEVADFDHDNDVDLSDFAIVQRCYRGAGTPPDMACAN